jgi:5-methylcytosine-specific restriction endonuclease McrA
MEHSEDFLALRVCFLPPISDLVVAADLLDEAADALLAGDHDRAREKLREAHIPAVHAYASRIMGAWDTFIHRRRQVDRPAGALKVPNRKPSGNIEAEVFARDGWRCRYCGVRVVLPKARKILADTFPDVVCWSGKDKDLHAAFYALSAVADHVVPHTLGGGSGPDNLVTTCQSCNYGKGDRLLAELGLIDPRIRPPVVDAWDGLGRLLYAHKVAAIIAEEPSVIPRAPGRSPAASLGHDAWFAELDRMDQGLSGRLLTLLSDCLPHGVSWALKDYLIIRLKVGQVNIQICGVAHDGEVVVPWLIGKQKDHFKGFAETIASALPEAHIRESPTQWIVTKDGKNRLHLRDLVKISPVLLDAIGSLAARMSNTRNPAR